MIQCEISNVMASISDQLGLNQFAFARKDPNHQALDSVLVTRSKERGKLKVRSNGIVF